MCAPSPRPPKHSPPLCAQLTVEALSAFLLLLVLLSILGSAVSRTSREVVQARQVSFERQSLAEQSLAVLLVPIHPTVRLPDGWVPDHQAGGGKFSFNSSSGASVIIPWSSALSSPKVPA
ncbi:Uncharacterised protein [uncultured archaeon]|nr:Uncharacterised protein [uncultured archaeon]